MQFRPTFLALFTSLLLVQSAVSTAIPEPEAGISDTIEAVMGNGNKKVSALNPSLLPNLKYYAEFSAASYCDPLNKASTRTHCSAKEICPLLTSNPVTTLYTFANTDIADTTGFLAKDESTKSLVLAFRGSSSIRNWIQNAQFGLEETKYCGGCKAHKGFLKGFQGVWGAIKSQIDKALNENKGYSVVVTGHSLGGAMATLAAVELRSSGRPCTLYSYGAPRVGNVDLSNFISRSGPNYRVAHLDDPVVRVPPSILGYGYISPEYHIKRGNRGDEVKAEDIDVVENPSGEMKGMDWDMHRWYLTNTEISKCNAHQGLELRDVRMRRSEIKWTRSDMS